MHPSTESVAGRLVLTLCHVAGMLDLVILPLWVGGMMQTYHFDPQVAGGIVTLYLVGTLVANAALARFFGRMPERLVATVGFAIPAVMFYAMTQLPGIAGAAPAPLLAGLHFIAGLGAGAGLVVTHGSIGRSVNPHRQFAIVNFGVSLFAILFFAVTPNLMKSLGVNAVFFVSMGTIALASVAALLAFPSVASGTGKTEHQSAGTTTAGFGLLALCFLGVVMLQTGNAITLSFVERVGDFRGFDAGLIGIMLAVGGLVPLLAPVAAALMQNKLPAIAVAVIGLVFHGILSATVSNSPAFWPYAVAYSLVISTVIFVHTFVFGLLAKLDPSGRTNAATPSMLMIGTAIGPILGGTVAKFLGYPQVGLTAAAAAILGALCFVSVGLMLRAREQSPVVTTA